MTPWWRKGKPHPFARGGIFPNGEGFLHATRRQHTTQLVVDSLASSAVGLIMAMSLLIIFLGLLRMPGELLLAFLYGGLLFGGAIYGAISALGRPLGCLVTRTSLRELHSGASIGVWALTWRTALLAVVWIFVLMAWMTFMRGREDLPFGLRFTRHVLVDNRRQ